MLVEDLKKCDGQKLIDFYNMENDYIKKSHIDNISYLIYLGKLKNKYDTLLLDTYDVCKD